MDTLGELTDGHRRQIAAYREKWKAIGLLTERVDRPRVEAALEALFREIEFQAPNDRLLFSSPAAAWADFPAWFPRIGRCLVAFWPYQLPLFDPQSFWRRFGGNRDTVDLAVCRVARPGMAWAPRAPRNGVPGTTLNAAVGREIWEAFDGLLDVDWAWRTARAVGEKFAEEHGRIEEQADREDPSNPIDVAEYIYLGPFQWLIHELACVDFCRTVLGARVNTALYDSLSELVRYGSLLLTFERLWIICERPAALHEGLVLARYGDATTVP